MEKRLLTYKEVAEEFGPNVWYWKTQVWRNNISNVSGDERRHLLDRRDIEQLIENRK